MGLSELLGGTVVGGYQQAQQLANQQRAADMQNTVQGVGLLAKLQQQQQEQAMRQALSQSGGDPEIAMKIALKTGNITAAHALAPILEAARKNKETARKEAFFSPENQAQFMEPGPEVPPANPVGEYGPNPPTQGPPKMNFDKFLEAAAARGVVNPETYATHKAANETRQFQIRSSAEQSLARLEQAKTNAQMLHEVRLQSARTAEERAAETARHNRVVEVISGQMANTNAELRRMGFDIQRERLDQARQQQTTKQTSQLGAALEKANLPEADAVLGAVEKALTDTPKIAEYISGPKSLLPDIVVRDPQILSGRQAFNKLFNITLKNRSGAAVTIPEFERLKAEFGTGAFKNEGQLKEAVRQAREIINKHYASVVSGFGPEAIQGYNENIRQFGGNVVLEPNKGGAPKGVEPTVWNAMTPQERALWKN